MARLHLERRHGRALRLVLAALAAFVGCIPAGPSGPAEVVVVPNAALTDSICARLGWGNCDIWEVSDDQALNNGSGGYGPLAHIIPADHLKNLVSTNDFDTAGTRGTLVALVIVDTGLQSSAGRSQKPPSDGGSGAASSSIPPLPATYTALGLHTGYSCVYLRHEGASDDTGWGAFVSPASIGTQPTCPPDHPGAASLPVTSTQHPLFTQEDAYPAVARWHEGRSGGKRWVPAFGLKCGNRWCIAARSSDTLPNPHAAEVPGGLNSITAKPYRNWMLRGWADVQHLGESPLTAGNPPTAGFGTGGIHASMVPDTGLFHYNLARFSAGPWVHVATLWLQNSPAPISKYRTRWKLKQGRNEIYLRTDVTKPTGWTGMLIAGTDTVELKVSREDHGTSFIPGVARFRWDFTDEQGWVRCDVGCCKVAPT